MGASDSLSNGMMALLFTNEAFAGIGDAGGLLPSSVDGSLVVGLHSASPGDDGDQTTNECAYTPYQRVAVVRTTAGWALSGHQAANVEDLQFPKCTAGSDTARFWSIGTASSGSGVLLFHGPMGSKRGLFVAETDDDVITCKGHGLSVDDRVIFYTSFGSTLPTGITAGTVYYVKTTPTADTFTISDTQGGSPVNLTADGSGVVYRLSSLAISENIRPEIPAGDLVVTNGS
jgi:hypothetical protein